MGSLVVKLDEPTMAKLNNMHHYSDLDVLSFKGPNYKEVPMAYDVEAVRIAVRNILMWRVGENILRPKFGHKLNLSMYQQLNQFNADVVSEEIKRAIEDNEPRAKVTKVSTRLDDTEQTNVLHVSVTYVVSGNGVADSAEFTEQTTIIGK